MPEKLQNLSEKVIHIRSNSAEPDKQLPVKYLSEIITARVEEIMMAIFYEIQNSGFADMLRSGVVVTGGCAQIPNLNSFMYELSGYKVRTGYPKMLFSGQNCDGINDTTAAPSIGLIFAAMEEGINCCQMPEEDVTEEEEPQSDNGEIFSEEEMKEIEISDEEKAELKKKEKERKKKEKEVRKAEKEQEKEGKMTGVISWLLSIKEELENEKV